MSRRRTARSRFCTRASVEARRRSHARPTCRGCVCDALDTLTRSVEGCVRARRRPSALACE
eukprot:4413103-Pleurochrysis_carterae.AAC.1